MTVHITSAILTLWISGAGQARIPGGLTPGAIHYECNTYVVDLRGRAGQNPGGLTPGAIHYECNTYIVDLRGRAGKNAGGLTPGAIHYECNTYVVDLRGRAGQDAGGLTPGVVLAGAVTPHTLEVGARVVQV